MERNKAYLIAFGKHLRSMIDKKGMTPEDVGAIGEIETKNVYRTINGEHSTGLSKIYSIAKGLGVKPKELFDFEFKEKD